MNETRKVTMHKRDLNQTIKLKCDSSEKMVGGVNIRQESFLEGVSTQFLRVILVDWALEEAERQSIPISGYSEIKWFKDYYEDHWYVSFVKSEIVTTEDL